MEIKQHQIEHFAQAKARVKVREKEFNDLKESPGRDTGTIWGKFGFLSPEKELEIFN